MLSKKKKKKKNKLATDVQNMRHHLSCRHIREMTSLMGAVWMITVPFNAPNYFKSSVVHSKTEYRVGTLYFISGKSWVNINTPFFLLRHYPWLFSIYFLQYKDHYYLCFFPNIRCYSNTIENECCFNHVRVLHLF